MGSLQSGVPTLTKCLVLKVLLTEAKKFFTFNLQLTLFREDFFQFIFCNFRIYL